MNNVVNFKPKPPPIKVGLVDKNFSTRWPCTVCGGNTDKVSIIAEGRQDLSSGDFHVGEHRTIRVCEFCLNAGDIDARLELGARQLECQAQALREIIGRLQVPTFAEWQARCEQKEREWREDYETDRKIEEIEMQSDWDELTDDLPF